MRKKIAKKKITEIYRHPSCHHFQRHFLLYPWWQKARYLFLSKPISWWFIPWASTLKRREWACYMVSSTKSILLCPNWRFRLCSEAWSLAPLMHVGVYTAAAAAVAVGNMWSYIMSPWGCHVLSDLVLVCSAQKLIRNVIPGTLIVLTLKLDSLLLK